MKGIIFDIQSYAIYDGPGIRTLFFLKGCPLRCIWCQNPESQTLKPQLTYFKEKCLKCGTCIHACQNDALQLLNNEIKRNIDLCIMCGRCVDACPNIVMEIIGKERTIPELVEIALRDKPFYDNSGGGITISGGEPTVQNEFLIDLLIALKNQGVHTAIETCGYFNEELVEELTKYVDLFLFDIKLIDSSIHKQYTGVPNEKILENFLLLLQKVNSERIITRIPLIPGVNTDEVTLKSIISFLKKINYHGPIHLMPYNKLTKTKYEKVGLGHLYRDMGDLLEGELDVIVRRFEEHGFHVYVNH